MASILKRGNRWQAQVSVSGQRRAKTFNLRSEAMAWARRQELEPYQLVTAEGKMTLVELLRLLQNERGSQTRLSYLDKHRLGSMRICDIQANDIADFLLWRERVPQRIGRCPTDISLEHIRRGISGALSVAVQRGWIGRNPVRQMDRTTTPHHFRERVPTEQEYARLCQAAYWDGKSYPLTLGQKTIAAFRFSMLTGMRAGEICAIEPSWLIGRVLHLPAEATKTKTARCVALSSEAMALLQLMMSAELTPVWGISNTQRNTAFCRLRDMCGLGDVRDSAGRLIQSALHFHDARAFFCTWAASTGEDGKPRLEPFELARQLGHQSLTMTMRYYRLTPEEIAKKLG